MDKASLIYLFTMGKHEIQGFPLFCFSQICYSINKKIKGESIHEKRKRVCSTNFKGET